MSTFREIEEVYLSDIIRRQKMSKGIVAETLGELQGERKLWVDTKFIEKWAKELWNFPHDCSLESMKDFISLLLEEAGISIKK